MNGKKYDILLLGSTGYTGQMILEYLLKKYEKEITNGQIKLLCAVRNINRLNEILLRLKEKEKLRNTEKIYKKEVDVVNNYDSILSCCKMCDVVVSTIGPYAIYGYNIVKACVQANCHYLDACGEHDFILRIYKEFNEIAKEKKLKIIHSASFISALSDLGTYIIQEEFLSKYKKPCSYVRIRLSNEGSDFRTVGKTTIKSALLFKKRLGNSYNKHYLCENKYDDISSTDDGFPLYEKKIKTTNYFFDYEEEFGYCFDTVYSKIEEAYVLWSNYLMNYKYGKNLVIDYKQYDAELSMPMYIIKRMFSMLINGLKYLTPVDYVTDKYVDYLHKPKTSDQLKKGFWKCTIVGEMCDMYTDGTQNKNSDDNTNSNENENKGNKKIILHLNGENEDPGYLLTAKIISESAISLFQNNLPNSFGVLSVSVGLGMALVERLKQASLCIHVEV
ncbi:saccharopine dehydrogenase [Plasmodium brasilianum]|uniref:Saccharopine dehydrogenase NADP binding domain-containing protein n=2 Tax=Plasmodium (Plasmodium) TaxID=418103 RepID=A0A1A8VTR5_PLAMA|nr:conserved protein, unknown function [Plasmodium malariae]KAI4840349.1 saccharopine dehydrogenase [Plasmodium brasilianum]SBS82216.1 conserved Plasmodium protein, unknown function [Plasmodium malariae]SBT70513.1 conserved protein, unknown function [Plasmodium malariae]SBT86441.1 conserved protein, unknown function [Plasmodium malariae]